ncbi:hypothetical protein JB92DRAFT_3102940 [Gautieria morchelliformis]|nr:hypothetical protein JB92DRAFT_3102940 [Gautieria morchelliformis]
MATPPLQVSAIIEAWSLLVATKYYNLATIIILVYDHCLTFDLEVEKIWKQGWTLPKWLWLVFRYVALITQVGLVLGDHLPIWTHDSCLLWLQIRVSADQIMTTTTSIMLILRVWAIFERARWTMFVMAATLVAQTGVSIWSYQAFTAAILPTGKLSVHQYRFTGCFFAPKAPDRVGQVASNFVGLLVLDTVIFLLTVLRLVKVVASGKQSTTSARLISVMLRDGVLYFLIICIVNGANVLLIQLPSVSMDLRPLNTEFTVNITVILVSRHFLNLRDAARPTTNLNSTLVGNLGKELQTAAPDATD